MPRRSGSKRLELLEDTHPAPVAEEMGDESAPELTDPGIVKVVRKKANKLRAQRRRGKLCMMLDMPLDVVLEICGHLYPKDLLNLSRTTKELRQFFTSKSALPLWKSAQLNLPGLPSCPPDLNELAYANLMFSTHCHGCLSNKCNSIFWHCRIRLCKKCRTEEELSGVKMQELTRGLEHLLPPGYKMADLVPPLELGSFIMDGHDPNSYYGPYVEDVILELQNTPVDRREILCDKRKQGVSLLEQEIHALETYCLERKTSRTNELDELRAARLHGIFERLEEDGWQEDVTYLTECLSEEASWRLKLFKTLPEVRKAQTLTPKIWNNIKDTILAAIQTIREARVREARLCILNNRLSELVQIVREFQLLEKYRDLRCREVAIFVPGVYELINPDVAAFEPQDLKNHLQAEIPKFVEKRYENARNVVTTALRQQFGLDASCDPFSLAVGAWFDCTQCKNTFTFDNILRHRCTVSRSLSPPPGMSREYFEHVSYKSFGDAFYGSVWDIDLIEVEFKNRKAVIEVCGLDVKTATVNDLDQADIRILCTVHDGFRPVMTWRTAMFDHGNSCSYRFEKATEEQAAAARTMEPNALQSHIEYVSNRQIYTCAHCTAMPKTSKGRVCAHLQNIHGITEPKEGDWVDTSSFELVPGPVFLISEARKETMGSILSRYLDKGVGTFFEIK